MDIKIALAGNPNCGKTTLFNQLTGASQSVGNWPGVTVEKKEGRLKGQTDTIIQDLPGIYSLSPYTPEEVVSRSYLVKEQPGAILNIVDGTNIERNLYLTTQLMELGLPVVVAVNMMDLVRKNGDRIDLDALGSALGCQVAGISALKGEGGLEAARQAVSAAQAGKSGELPRVFTGSVERVLAHIEESIQGMVDSRHLRWYAVKLFERDGNVLEELGLGQELASRLEERIASCEQELDDDAESIVTSQRYAYIRRVVEQAVTKQAAMHSLSASDRIDRVVTSRILASRTIEQDRDRKMTVMTTGFIPCGAKLPIISLFAGAVSGGSPWVAVSAFLTGIAAVVLSGIMLKKFRAFAGEPAPFVMELPAYHAPSVPSVLRATWERGWSFIKRAGTVILLSSIVLWFLQGYGFQDGVLQAVEDNNASLLSGLGRSIAWVFAPIGWVGDMAWKAAVATLTGLIAKEEVVSTLGVLYNVSGEALGDSGEAIWLFVAADFGPMTAYSFLMSSLLCAPCFAAMGAIKREMNNAKWTRRPSAICAPSPTPPPSLSSSWAGWPRARPALAPAPSPPWPCWRAPCTCWPARVTGRRPGTAPRWLWAAGTAPPAAAARGGPLEPGSPETPLWNWKGPRGQEDPGPFCAMGSYGANTGPPGGASRRSRPP